MSKPIGALLFAFLEVHILFPCTILKEQSPSYVTDLALSEKLRV